MWSPEEKLHRAGRALESDLSLRYLAPGAFTILPPGSKQPPPPESASNANKHKLTPTAKKNRNAAFAIIAEPGSNPGSRSPSPTGRVSPFRGRGFNPVGSRHVSPLPSPPLENRKFSPTRAHQSDSKKHSKIPTLSRRGSNAALFGEPVEVTSPRRANQRTRLTKQLSQSLTNITPKHVSNKPPPSPRRTGRQPKPPAFQKLSPIIGSSPEPSPDQHKLKPHSQSSPSKIPRSRSQPPSSRISPSVSGTTSRVTSRNTSRNVSRNTSREPSPNKFNSKIHYKNVKAKVNSFSTVKPKVPPKPQVPKSNEKHKLERKESVVRSIPVHDNNNSNINNVNNNNNKSETVAKENNLPSSSGSKTQKKEGELEDVEDSKDNTSSNRDSPGKLKKVETSKEIKKVESTPKLIDLLSPSTTAVVSSTTTTVTQPLKIEAKFDASDSGDTTSVYLPDARALSATSVSTAMNRMNDTVMDTKTLMKESNMSSKLSPAATTIISMTNENPETKPRDTAALGTNNSALPPVETVNNNNNNNNNFVPQLIRNQSGISIPSGNSVKNVEVKPMETNGKGAVISPERGVGLTDALPKSANQRIKEARTMVATDVQPIRITVKEKPSNSELQSGNIRLPVSATNGINERPGLPPPQPPPEEPPATPEPPKGFCGRLTGCCKKSKTDTTVKIEKEKKKSKLWCCSKNKEMEEHEEETRNRIDSDTSLIQEEVDGKKRWWQKIKCCKRNKIADTNLPKAQRKDSWAERTESYTSETVKKSPKDICKNFLRTIFCINLCSRKRRREEEEALRRKASLMSKKKSLTPPIVPEEPKSKLDAGLVEHSSLMKGAIPVLPVPLAWLCLILNVFLPGIGTIVSGFLCLCMGKPRFSTHDGMKQRVGACIIDFFIGCGQLFTVLFCLVGWGWSIWWGVIMIKIAKKYRKIRRAEKAMEEDNPTPVSDENHLTRDPERGS